MIKGVTSADSKVNLHNKPKGNTKSSQARYSGYVDSFVKQSKKSAPMLLSLTAIYTLFDSKSRSIPIGEAVLNNLTNFFLPVLAVSSALLAFIENRKTTKPEK